MLVHNPLVEVNFGGDSISSSAERYVRAVSIILEKHHDIYAKDRRAKSRLVFRAGKYHVLEGRDREAIPFFAKAFWIDPLNLRALAGALMIATGTIGLYRRART